VNVSLSPARLEARIARLRNQVRRLLAVRGLGWVVGLLVPTVILLGLVDWAVHLDPVVRAACLAALAGFLAWLLLRYVLTPLIVRFADLDIALKIEQRWPGLNDRLASTIQFLHAADDDERLGSPALRAATVRQTLEETQRLDFRKVVEPGPAFRAVSLAAGSLLMAALFLAAAPELSDIALKRLFNPFGPDRWPQQTHLTLLERETPLKVARGDTFTLAVATGKGERVPPSARATYVFEDGQAETESLRAVEGGIFRGRIETVNRSFRFSVAAGDDSTSIRGVPVKVVPPPALKDMTIRLLAPSYTGLEPQTMAPGRTQIRAVVGTQVAIDALANKPIARAVLHLGEKAAATPIVLDSARTGMKTQLVLTESAPFWIELQDTEGFKNREAVRTELRALPDEAPRVTIEEPPHDRNVPARAVVPIAFTVADDFGIQLARLIYKISPGSSEPTEEVALLLWEAPRDGERVNRVVKQQEIRYEWNLAPLNLTPGAIITFHAEARDFDDLKGPNLGKSREIRLRVLSDEDILHEFDDTRRDIREETARILAMQKQALTPVQDGLRTIAETGQTDAVSRDEIKNAAMIQRQVASRVTSPSDGLDQKIRRALDDLKNFKIANADAQKQMEQMQASVDQIRRQHLGPAEQGLTRASKSLDESQGQNPSPESNPSRAEPGKSEPEGSERGKADAGKAEAASKAEAGKAGADKAEAASKAEAGKAGADKAGAARSEAGKAEASQARSGSGQSDAAKAQPGRSDAAKAQPGQSPREAEPTRTALKEAESNQKAIADELQKMLDGLSEFETYRGVVKDAQKLLKEQEEAMKHAAEAAGKPELMGKTPDALTPEQKADLANIASRQSGLARELQDLQGKMDEMSQRLDESDPLAAAALREAAQQSRKQETAAKMGEAAEQLQRNQMGAARNGQEQVRQDLKSLVDAIQNRRERELARLVKELKNAEAELDKLRQRQAENLKKTREARNNPDARQRAEQLKKLAKEQAEIQQELERQLKRLAKLNTAGAARAGQKASARMSKAGQELDQGQGEQAEQDEDEALADLEDAEEEVQQARREAEEQLAMEQLIKMADHLRSLAERQAKMVTSTEEFEKLRVERAGQLTLAQKGGIRSLGRVQEGLKDETGDLIEKLEGAPVFALTLKRAAENMTEAADRLQAIKTDEETRRAVTGASKRFQQLLDALKPDKGAGAGGQPPGGGNQGGGGAAGGGDGIPAAAQVKMLKALQEEINERTEYYDEHRRRKKELTDTQVAELEKLEVDQGTLADLARDLTRPKKDDGED
jgi:hypothetical protein